MGKVTQKLILIGKSQWSLLLYKIWKLTSKHYLTKLNITNSNNIQGKKIHITYLNGS